MVVRVGTSDQEGALTTTERFWSKVDKRGADECWPWMGATQSKGYGQFSYGGRPRLATHIAWLLSRGELPGAGQCVCHSCDVPRCVNPAHLFIGTQADNMRDMQRKGRARGPARSHRGTYTPETSPSRRLSYDDVRRARAMLSAGQSQHSVACALGVSRGAIQALANGRTWKEVE